MGFNKRYVTRETILRTDESRLDKLFNADALIMDVWASKFRELYSAGLAKDEIIFLFTY
jgi:hypothetical protein